MSFYLIVNCSGQAATVSDSLKTVTINNTYTNPTSEKSIGLEVVVSGLSTGGGIGINQEIGNSPINSSLIGINNEFTDSTAIKVGVRNVIVNENSDTRGIHNILISSGFGIQYGIYNQQSASGDCIQYGTYQNLSNTGTGPVTGTSNNLSSSGSGNQTGTENVVTSTSSSNSLANRGLRNSIGGDGNETRTGSYTSLGGSGDGNRTGYFVIITGDGNGTNHAINSNILSTGNGDSYGSRFNLNGSGTGNSYGSNYKIAGSNSGVQYGSYRGISNIGSGIKVGSRNEFFSSASGNQYGTYTTMINNSPDIRYGTYNLLSGNTDGNQYGTYNSITTSGSGNHYAGWFSAPGDSKDFAAVFNEGNVVANEVGGDYDFRIESDDNEFLFLADGSTNRIGIGTNAPDRLFHVQKEDSNGAIALIENTNTGSSADGLMVRIGPDTGITAGNTFIVFRDGGDNLMGDINGNGAGGVTYGTTSDRRLKQNIRPFKNGLSLVKKINAKEYEMKINPELKQVGFIAQELYEVFPQVVSGTPANPIETPMTVDYGKLTPVLVQAIQELADENEKLKNLNKKQDELIYNLAARLDNLEADIQTYKANSESEGQN